MDVIRGPGGIPDGAPEVEMALLDLDGVIVSANQAWYDFCLDNDGDPARCGVGSSYLDACASAGTDAAAVLDAVRSALAGQLLAPITLQIPCDDADQPRWFDLLVSSRTDSDGQCIGATVTLSRTKASRRPIDLPDTEPSTVQYPDRPRLAMESLVAELGERVREVLSAQARLHALLRATASLAAESDLKTLLDLIISCGRELINARAATLVRAGAEMSEPARPALSPEASLPPWTEAPGAAPAKTSLRLPLTANGDLFGTLVLDDSPNGRFSREDQWLANEFATRAGFAIRHALLVADRERQER